MKDGDMSKDLYYIYIDTKIQGAIEQLLSYFQSNVFNANACIAIYAKYYKENYKIISKLFETHNIRYKFIKKYSDISFDDGKVVFYLFNAQSNCRMVAFRNVSHVFITHGESNKKSSVKPIVRIYDHVITSGQVGIDRYLKAGLFTESDIENNRVIRLGSTFVGQNNYSYKKESRTLLYAPTWEGGVPDENFSSITNNIKDLLVKVIKNNNIKNIIIQKHPNLGHRDKSYILSLGNIVSTLVSNNIKVSIVKNIVSTKEKLRAFYTGFRYISPNKKIDVSHAISDISAMEVQLLVKKIPTMVVANEHRYKELIVPKRMRTYYLDSMFYLDGNSNQMVFTSPESISSYVESYHEGFLENASFGKRIEWLCQYVEKDRVSQIKYRKSI
ncbi:hypothetical protein [Psychrobacter sp. NG27]|uniref:hypothetical protein n=1 Tax=Psychrobacter sp. NG27 TaxID=2781966 RepID=UPI0018DF4394|nr:hypothetical protein [Psychrobacter sp. NG27]